MRAFAVFVVALLIVDLANLQAAEPRFRPALIGNGPNALINLIDTKKLVQKGQRDGLLSFHCVVTTWGGAANFATYRGTPGSEALEKEVTHALSRCRFIPAIYDGKPTEVVIWGAALFVVTDGKPHLRIFANQNRDDIAKWNDFIAPQIILPAEKVRVRDELLNAMIHHQKGVVELATTVDENGNWKESKVLSEDPPGFNFARVALKLFPRTKYIPGFRNGHPVDCTFHHYLWFRL